MRNRRQILIRFICMVMICALALRGGAPASIFDDAAQLIWPENEPAGWTMTLGMTVQAYPPFGERRIELLNRLIQHMRLRITQNDNLAKIRLIIDGYETDAIMALAADSASENKAADMKTDSEDDGQKAAEPDEKETEAGLNMPGTEAADQMHAVFQLLEEGAAFLKELPDLYPEGCSEKKVKQKLKTGIAVKSVTMMIQPAENEEHPLQKMIQGTKEGLLRGKIGKWVFKGRQRFTLLYDEDGQLLKASYSGRAGETEETLRNITLEWRLKRTEKEKTDEVTLKTPAVDGSSRDNWILSRKWTDAVFSEEETIEKQEESLDFSFEYDRKHGNNKAAYKWEGSLTGGAGISGGISYTQKKKNETETITIRPDWSQCSEKQVTGTLEIIRITDKVIQEHVTLDLDWQRDGAQQSINEERVMSTDDVLQNGASPSVQQEVLKSILTRIPEEDLGFLKEEIPEADWQTLMEEAAR